MLRVELGVNVLSATLSERESVVSSIYALKLTPTENKSNPKTLRPIDLSVPGHRVNRLQITLVESPDLEDLPASLVFLVGGDYIYEFFDSEGNFLERGMMQYDTTVPQKDYNDNTINEKVYNE